MAQHVAQVDARAQAQRALLVSPGQLGVADDVGGQNCGEPAAGALGHGGDELHGRSPGPLPLRPE
ncbi:MAG TPA: hypothetical protein VMR86_00135 [Myxococcota bacterium]|nr:hypothetical protein [Myxococcota bacterium]